ncbi:MAG: dihydrodipicolinate synthase family protein [Clostridia bacterium]|nr:dihydrodipicolinate synthase family protein [Clostridia bacterium]
MEYNFGSYPTMITPYTKDGQVDYETAKKYVKWYAENNCDGIFAICQSSEIFFLTLEEKLKLNKLVYETVQEIKAQTGKAMTVVSSGHTADTIEEQAEELNKIIESGTDALILITNRLDINNEGDDVWIENAQKLLSKLPKDINLGLYECPYPYKRLVTPKILDWCLQTGRFYFMKDTCCDMQIINERLEQLKGSHFYLLNANCQTLLESLRSGGKGYCGIMANYHPALYSWLCKNYNEEKADKVQAFLCMAGFTEVGLPYPLTAKYHMNLVGIPTENIARNRKSEEMTPYAESCMKQMKLLSDALLAEIMD